MWEDASPEELSFIASLGDKLNGCLFHLQIAYLFYSILSIFCGQAGWEGIPEEKSCNCKFEEVSIKFSDTA